jgi:hypothetical protein
MSRIILFKQSIESVDVAVAATFSKLKGRLDVSDAVQVANRTSTGSGPMATAVQPQDTLFSGSVELNTPSV